MQNISSFHCVACNRTVAYDSGFMSQAVAEMKHARYWHKGQDMTQSISSNTTSDAGWIQPSIINPSTPNHLAYPYVQPLVYPSLQQPSIVQPSVATGTNHTSPIPERVDPNYRDFGPWRPYDDTYTLLIGYKIIRHDFLSRHDGRYLYKAGEWHAAGNEKGLFMLPEINQCGAYFHAPMSRVAKVVFFPEDMTEQYAAKKLFVIGISHPFMAWPPAEIVYPELHAVKEYVTPEVKEDEAKEGLASAISEWTNTDAYTSAVKAWYLQQANRNANQVGINKQTYLAKLRAYEGYSR